MPTANDTPSVVVVVAASHPKNKKVIKKKKKVVISQETKAVVSHPETSRAHSGHETVQDGRSPGGDDRTATAPTTTETEQCNDKQPLRKLHKEDPAKTTRRKATKKKSKKDSDPVSRTTAHRPEEASLVTKQQQQQNHHHVPLETTGSDDGSSVNLQELLAASPPKKRRRPKKSAQRTPPRAEATATVRSKPAHQRQPPPVETTVPSAPPFRDEGSGRKPFIVEERDARPDRGDVTLVRMLADDDTAPSPSVSVTFDDGDDTNDHATNLVRVRLVVRMIMMMLTILLLGGYYYYNKNNNNNNYYYDYYLSPWINNLYVGDHLTWDSGSSKKDHTPIVVEFTFDVFRDCGIE